MEQESPRRRGRPAGPPGHALGQYLRERREARSWTVRELASAVGLPSTSASYISQLEAGSKVPNPTLAEKLALALGDPLGVFELWALTGRRSDPHEAAVSRRTLARLLGDPSLAHDPHYTPPGQVRFEAARQSLLARRRISVPPRSADPGAGTRAPLERADAPAAFEQDLRSAGRALDARATPPLLRYSTADREPPPDSPAGHARSRPPSSSPVLVPVISEGADPERALDPLEGSHREGLEAVRLEPGAVRALRLERPFAWRLGREGARRVPALLSPGDVVVITREWGVLSPNEVYAVRHDGRVELSLVLWNGRELLLLPPEGESDFAVLRLGSERELRRVLVGHVATVVRGLEPPGP